MFHFHFKSCAGTTKTIVNIMKELHFSCLYKLELEKIFLWHWGILNLGIGLKFRKILYTQRFLLNSQLNWYKLTPLFVVGFYFYWSFSLVWKKLGVDGWLCNFKVEPKLAGRCWKWRSKLDGFSVKPFYILNFYFSIGFYQPGKMAANILIFSSVF